MLTNSLQPKPALNPKHNDQSCLLVVVVAKESLVTTTNKNPEFYIRETET